MTYISSVPLNVLVVEDSDFKCKKVCDIIKSCGANIMIHIEKDQIGGQQKIIETKYDLLILDMELPARAGDESIRERAGQEILDDLFTDDRCKMPNGIIVLTEHEHLKTLLLAEYPDVAVIHFDLTSYKWSEGLERKVKATAKSKLTERRIIYCEGLNDQIYNLVNISNVEFRGLQDSRAVYLAAKNEQDKFALRDRDFLGSAEKENLRRAYPNYFILNYYCIENYILHPDNIKEVRPLSDIEGYRADLLMQKKQKFVNIVQDYKIARNAYTDIQDHDRRFFAKASEQEITDCLSSDSFEFFYLFFDMAGKKDKGNVKSYDRNFLNSLNLDKNELAKTNWFKEKISSIVDSDVA